MKLMKMSLKDKSKSYLKWGLSLWVLYHLLVVILMPNLGSFPGRRLMDLIAPYGSAVGLNASWNFFSPDPAHTMYLRYVVYYDNDEGIEVKEPEENFIPQSRAAPVLDIRDKRSLYAMRFMILDSKRLETILGPWLCKKYPEASRIHMEHVIETVPPLDEAMTFKTMELQELSKEIPYVNVSVHCGPGADKYQDEEL